MSNEITCPCGSKLDYSLCCRPAHQGTAAPTPEALMRSRYAAFVLGLRDYLLATCDAQHRQAQEVEMLDRTLAETQWDALEIVAVSPGAHIDEGYVEFVAYFSAVRGGGAGRHREKSRFERRDGRWFYVDAQYPALANLGRNDPCPCGSGKKAKKCHG